MKSSLENAFMNGQVTRAENELEFDAHSAMYAHALMRLTDSVITEENYLAQFYHEIDKAHFFRVTGHSEIGLHLLNELEYCGLDSVEQDQLNYWKTQFAGDQFIEELGPDILDTLIVIDTTGYIQPQLAVNAYSFGALIYGLNEISYPNCHFYARDLDRQQHDELIVYPNPAMTAITITSTHQPMEGAGMISIYQPDGRSFFSKKTNSNEPLFLRLNVSDWTPGIYRIRYTKPDGGISDSQLVVQ